MPTPPLHLSLPSPSQQQNFLANSVRAHLPAWEAAGASTRVLRWLRRGFRLPWLRGPCRPFHLGVSFSQVTSDQLPSLTKNLQQLLDVGAIEPGTCGKFVSRAFLVPKPGGKWRLVVDLRHVNTFLRKAPCRFETLKRLRNMVEDDDWMVSLDLQDGFYAVGIHAFTPRTDSFSRSRWLATGCCSFEHYPWD